MQHFRLLLFTAFIFLAVGCSQTEQKKVIKTIQGSWQLVDISKQGADNNKTEDKLLKKARDKKELQEGSVVSFFKDETFTMVNGAGTYTWGKWHSINNGRGLALMHDNKSDTVAINLSTENKKQTLRIADKDSLSILTYVQYAYPMKDFQEDPFYSSNNQWRLKPAKLETSAQLHERLANYFRHLAYILNAAKERKQEVVSFEYSQGPVKIYNGGIGIHPHEIIPPSWTHSYYDDAQAMWAYTMYEAYLSNSQYKGGGTGNWIEDDYNILLSIYAAAKEGKFPKLKE